MNESSTTDIIQILEQSTLLHTLLPRCRRLALIETIRGTPTLEFALEILTDNLSSSPYIPHASKDRIANLAFNGQFDTLREQMKCSLDSENDSAQSRGYTSDGGLESYRAMVVSMFSRSRKIAEASAERRRKIGHLINRASSKDQLVHLAIESLETSRVFTAEARERIANDLFDERYDLLLLPNRFDCEEVPRLIQAPEELDAILADEECPLCLGTCRVEKQTPCRHRFCRKCLEDWARTADNETFDCPVCCAPIPTESLSKPSASLTIG